VPRRPRLSRYDLGLLGVSIIWGANFSAIKYALAELACSNNPDFIGWFVRIYMGVAYRSGRKCLVCFH
jgi:drug/metabolite transporter (DMT)-like permease